MYVDYIPVFSIEFHKKEKNMGRQLKLLILVFQKQIRKSLFRQENTHVDFKESIDQK